VEFLANRGGQITYPSWRDFENLVKMGRKMKKSRHQMPDSELALPNPDDQRLSKSTFQEKC
jgi:hypothetical protein